MNSTPASASVRRTALKSVMKPGAPACLPQLVGEGLEVHEILQPLFDRTAEPLADEGAVDVALVEVDDVVDRRALGRRHTKLRSSGITHIGLRPAWTRRMLSKALRNDLAQYSHVGPAVCGVIVMVSTLSRGLSFEGGSSTITSRPAPAMRLVMSALCRAISSTTGPRHVFTSTAVGFIMVSCRSEIMFLVWAVSGTCSVTTSAILSSSSSSTKRTPSASSSCSGSLTMS